MEYDHLNNSLLSKIVGLAVKRQTPLIILEDPRKRVPNATEYFTYIATIGNVDVGFDGFSPADLVDLYAELKSGLEAEEAIKADHVARMGALVDAKSPQ